MSDCKTCKNYQGDCGNHTKDQFGHIIYDEYVIPVGYTSCPDYEKGRTYGDIYNKACSHICDAIVSDWRPADGIYINVKEDNSNAVILYLDNGDRVIYIEKEK